MLPMSSPEWPCTTTCKDVVIPLVFNIDEKHSLMKNGLPLYDVLSSTFSDNTKAVRMLIDGGPGMGKTTSIRTICIKWSMGELLKHFKLVILISLRETKVMSIKDLFHFIAFDDQELVKAVIDYVEYTHGKEILFIFDGFDELNPEERIKDSLCLRIIKGDILTECSVIVTSRPHASECLLEQKIHFLIHVEILGFNKAQVHSCIKNSILAEDLHVAEVLISEFEERPSILSLCYVPLNCAIMISIHDQFRSNFPDTQTKLFQYFILGMLKRYAVVVKDENLKNELDCCPVDSGLPKSIEPSLTALGKLAYVGIQENKFIFSYTEIKNCFPDVHECLSSRHPVERFCLGLMTSTVFTSDSGCRTRKYQFLHSTIQEYLAAIYCLSASFKELTSFEAKVDFLRRCLRKSQFKQFVLFYAGLSKLKGLLPVLEKLLHFNTFNILSFVGLSNMLTYCHLTFESQNFCLFQHLYFCLSNKSVMVFKGTTLSAMDCTVIAHFLCSTGHSWKELNFQNCHLNAQSMDALSQVFIKYYDSNTLTFESVDLSDNLPTLITKIHCFKWLSRTKHLKVHCNVQHSQSDNQLQLGCLTSVPKIDIKASFMHETIYQAYVDTSSVILYAVDTNDLFLFDLKCVEILDLRKVKKVLIRSALLYLRQQISNPIIKVITFMDCSIGFWEDITTLASIKTLTKLSLVNVGITGDEAQKFFEMMTHNANLKYLDLSGNPICNKKSDSCNLMLKEMISVNKTLETLNLLHINACDEIIPFIIAGLNSNCSLKILNVDGNQISVEATLDLIQCIHRSCLISLHILGIQVVNSEMPPGWNIKIATPNMSKVELFCAMCTRFDPHLHNSDIISVTGNFVKSITTLDLQGMEISVILAKTLFHSLEQNTFLKSLNLSRNAIPTSGDASVCDMYHALESMLSNNTFLRSLCMDHCDLLDSVSMHISRGLAKNHSLQELSLYGNKICTNGASLIIKSLCDNKQLEILDMSNNDIEFWSTDLSLVLAEMALNNNSLKYLALAGYPSIRNHNKVVRGRVVHIDINLIPQSADLRSFFNTVSMWGFNCINITDNSCLLEYKCNSWHMSCQCYKSWPQLYFDQHTLCFKLATSINAQDFHYVDFSRSDISSNEVTLMFKSLLRKNCFIKDLNLSNNCLWFNEEQTAVVSEATKSMLAGCSLQVLCLSNCALTDMACKAIADGLRHNKSLLNLDLSKNCITGSGATAIFESLTECLSILEVLNLADNHNMVCCDDNLKRAIKSMFSMNSNLVNVNLLNAINDDIIVEIADALMKNVDSKLEILGVDIHTLGISAMACLLEALSKLPQLEIRSPSICFKFKHLVCSQGLCNFANKTLVTKLFCAQHKICDGRLSASDSAFMNTKVLDLSNTDVSASLIMSLFQSLQNNKQLQELNLFGCNLIVCDNESSESVGDALELMLTRNESLLHLNLCSCNVVINSVGCGLAAGLKENKFLKFLHIDIRSLHYSLIIDLLKSFNSSKLVLITINDVGILHVRSNPEDDTCKHWSIAQHGYNFLPTLSLQWSSDDPIQLLDRLCFHPSNNGSMILKFSIALCEQDSSELLSSIKEVKVYRGYSTVEWLITSFVACPRQNLEHIDIDCDVKLTKQMGNSLKLLLANSPTLTLLAIRAPIGDNFVLNFTEGLVSCSSLKRLSINIEFLSIKGTTKLLHTIESSKVMELELIPLLTIKRQAAESSQWCMKITKNTALHFVDRLYEYTQQNSIPLRSIFTTLDLCYHVAMYDECILKSLESKCYLFIEGLKVNIMLRECNEHEEQLHRIGTMIDNMLSRQCKIKVLRVNYMCSSLMKNIVHGLNNISLTVLDLSGDTLPKQEICQLLKQLPKLRELSLTYNTLSQEEEIPLSDVGNAFKEFITYNQNLKTLVFCVNFNSDEICTAISSASLGSLESLCISAHSVSEKGITTLLSSISSDSQTTLNTIEFREMCIMTKPSPELWHLEVTDQFIIRALHHLFHSLNNISNFHVENPVIFSHYKGHIVLPLFAFGNQSLSRSFKFHGTRNLTKVSLHQGKIDQLIDVMAIEDSFTSTTLDTLVLHSLNNMTVIKEMIACIAKKMLSLNVLHLTADVCTLNINLILSLLTLLKDGILTEVYLGQDAQVKLKHSPMPVISYSTESAELCLFFCILNESPHSEIINSILTSLTKLDFCKAHVDNTVVIRLLKCISGNNNLKELGLPRTWSIRSHYVADMGVAIKECLTINKSLTVLNFNDISYNAITCEFSEGLARNWSLKHIYVHPMMIQCVLLKSVLSHDQLLNLYSFCTDCIILHRDSENQEQWQSKILENDDEEPRILRLFLFCALSNVFQDDSSTKAVKKKALSILNSLKIICLQVHFRYLNCGGLTLSELMDAIKVNLKLKSLDIYDCPDSSTLLQTVEAITHSLSVEKVCLHFRGLKCPSFDGICNVLRRPSSLNDLTIFSSTQEVLSALILAFNKNCEITCSIKIIDKFSNISILRSKGSASWSVDLSSAGNNVLCHTLVYLFHALRIVQEKDALNISFHFSESLQSLNLAMVDVNSHLLIVILQSVVGKSTLKHLDLTGSKLFVDEKVDTGIIHGLLSHHSHLECLNMTLCSIDNSTCGHIAEGLKSNTSLKVLELSGNKIQSEGALKVFRALNGNSTLEVLDLSYNEELTSEDNGEIAEAIQSVLQTENSSIKFINLGFCNIADVTCNGIASGLQGNTILKRLDLQSNNFTDKSIGKMLKNCNNLEELNLSMNKRLTLTEGLENTFEQMIKTSTCLQILKLSGSVNDIIVSRIISGMKFKQNLLKLDVDECPLSAKTVADLVTSCEYEGFELFVANKKCTYTCEDWNKAYQWQIENNSFCKSDNMLFYLLILSVHRRSTALGQMAYGKLHSVTDLDLSDCNLSSSQFLSIVKSLSFIPNLVELNLSVNKHLIDDSAEAVHVCRALNDVLLQKRIKALNISSTSIHPQSWEHLFSGLKSSVSSLEVLDISGNNVGQEGSATLIHMLSNFGGPIKLNVSDCTIPDEFFNNELMNVLRLATATKLKLNCDQHQQDLLNSSNASLEVSCITPLMWWHQKISEFRAADT